MIKKLLLSLTIIVAVGASAFTATKALLSDQVTLSANAFSSGSVDLQIKIGGDPYGDTHVGFTETVFPGQTKTKFFKLKNNKNNIPLTITTQTTNINNNIPNNK